MTPEHSLIISSFKQGALPHDTTTFAGFMRERHEIYLRRLDKAKAPWTADPILSKFRFCNVYRELDTVTVWVRKNIREVYADHPNLWFMLAAARQINHPPMLEELLRAKNAWPTMPLPKWNPENMRKVMNARKARGEQIYTGAYMLTNILDKNNHDQPHDKPWFTTNKCLGSLVPLANTVVKATSMGETHAVLRSGYGWGGFLAYEVCCDMRWARYGAAWKDAKTFAHAGPGAVRGLNRISSRRYDAPLAEATCKAEMIELLAEMRSLWPKTSKRYPQLEMREIEHTLCEFDKHQRVMLGQGKPRSLYHPPNQEKTA